MYEKEDLVDMSKTQSQDATLDRLVIVNADDFGLHEDIDRGIQEAHLNGIVTSASIVACGDAFGHAVEMIRTCPELDVGLHFALIGEKPVADHRCISSLIASDGRFFKTYKPLLSRFLLEKIDVTHIYFELEAQLNLLLRSGISPSHLDSHQHVHMLPSVWRVVLDLARRFNIPFVRIPRFNSIGSHAQNCLDTISRVGLNFLSRKKFRLFDRPNSADNTVGLHLSGRLNEDHLCELLTQLPPGLSELVVHPGITSHSLREKYQWGYRWTEELSSLTSPRVKQMTEDLAIRLVRRGSLPASNAPPISCI